MTRWLALALLLIACGDSGGGNTNPDAAAIDARIDALMPDAPAIDAPSPDALIVDAEPSASAQFTWEIRVGSVTGPNGTCAPSTETFMIDLGGGMMFTAPCPNGSAGGTASFSNMPPGTYNAMVSLNMGSTVESIASFPGLTLVSGATTDLGHIVFVVAQLRR